jgi:peroxiredoxin
MSRRTLLSLLVPLLLVASYFVVTGWVSGHVDSLIQQAVAKPLPRFSIADRAGKTWTNGALLGKRAVLHFFRSRCHACDAEAPAMRELETNLPADVVLLHVMTDAVLRFPAAESEATIAAKGFVRPVVMADAAFADAFHKSSWSQVTPITYVVDATGVVRYGLRGAQTRAAIEQALAAAR